jgi:DnaK suppressor protein
MDRDNLNRFRKMLMEEKARVLASIRGASSTYELTGDEADRANAINDARMDQTVLRRSDKFLKKIDRALQKIDIGEFGICEDCGDEIGIRRLESRPVTTLCISCKEIQEKREGSYASQQEEAEV